MVCLNKLRAGILIAGIACLAPDASACFPLYGEVATYREKAMAPLVESLKSADRETRIQALLQESLKFAAVAPIGGEPVSYFPVGTKVREVRYPGKSSEGLGERIDIVLEYPADYLKTPNFSAFRVYSQGREFMFTLMGESFTEWNLRAIDPATGAEVDINDLLPQDTPSNWTPEVDDASVAMSLKEGKPATRSFDELQKNLPVINPGNITGSLSGKTIYINQAHGWFDDFTWTGNRWRVQRGLAFGINEDLAAAEFMNLYVIPYLRNAGAKVQTVRESDHQTNMVIVDNADTAAGLPVGQYVETGTWSTSTINGFKQKTTATWVGVSVNPFNQGTGANRLTPITTGSTPTATATWTATIPASGYYNVYASWTGFSARARDAQYLVHHSGGVTEVRVDQTLDGYTWNLLGNFYFEAGAPVTERRVVLTNQSSDTAATNVSADAVRWGGGMGDVARHANGISNRPRWEEEAVNYLQFNGFGYSGNLYTGDDDESGGWSNRPQYARWEHSVKDGSREDAIYFAFHTNAASGTARGLSTYRSSTATQASINLMNAMHDVMYSHIEGQWADGWTVRGKISTNFGENSQSSLGTGLPGFLIEGLFHDNQADATMYGEPKFRQDYARSISFGVMSYFQIRDGRTYTKPPEPPVNPRVVTDASGNAVVTWVAGQTSVQNQFRGDAATGYKVFTSRNGFGFDNGVAVTGTSHTITGLQPGDVRYIRVAATNVGGQSFPTETLVAARGDAGAKSVLVVNGFDRNQRSQVPQINLTNVGNPVLRLDPRTFQAFNYVIEHSRALVPTGVRISSTSNEAVIAGSVVLGGYDSVFWILGEESTADETFSTAEQTLVRAYLAGANKYLFVSGSELGWDLGSQGTAADQAFLRDVLGVTYTGDDAATYATTATTGEIFSGVTGIGFTPAAGARYDADSPDVFTAAAGSTAALTYSGGTGGVAAISRGASTNRVIVLGFPFEVISSFTVRETLIDAVAEDFDLLAPPAPSPSTLWMLTQ